MKWFIWQNLSSNSFEPGKPGTLIVWKGQAEQNVLGEKIWCAKNWLFCCNWVKLDKKSVKPSYLSLSISKWFQVSYSFTSSIWKSVLCKILSNFYREPCFCYIQSHVREVNYKSIIKDFEKLNLVKLDNDMVQGFSQFFLQSQSKNITRIKNNHLAFC